MARTSVHLIETDWGLVEAPLYGIELHKRCRLRKDGEVDRRTKNGKLFHRLVNRYVEMGSTPSGFDKLKQELA